MRFQKLPLRFDVNVTRSTLIARRSAKNGRSGMLRRTTTASQQRVFCGNLRRRDYVTRKRPPERLEAAEYDDAIKSKNKRENDHGNACQTNTHRFQRDS
jgi:hypothetical protein